MRSAGASCSGRCGQVSRERTSDSYQKVGDYFLPTGRQLTRSEKGRQVSSFELKLTRLRYF